MDLFLYSLKQSNSHSCWPQQNPGLSLEIFFIILEVTRNQDSSVGIVLRLQGGYPRNFFRFSKDQHHCFLLRNVWRRTEPHKASCSMGKGVNFDRGLIGQYVKLTTHLLSSAAFKDGESHTSIRQRLA